jgi:hypothetical protein
MFDSALNCNPVEPINMATINYENWGRLVKTWATGKSYFEDGTVYPVPKTLEEMQEQLDAVQSGLKLPKRMKKLEVVTMASDTMTLRLPPADLVAASEERFTREDYTFPPFYDEVYQHQPQPMNSYEERMKFHARRIGDYTIANCC